MCACVCACFPTVLLSFYTGTKSCCAIMLTEAHPTPCRHTNTHSRIHTHTGARTRTAYTYAPHTFTQPKEQRVIVTVFSVVPSAPRKGTDLSSFPLALNMHASQPFMWVLSCVLCEKSRGYFLTLAAHQFFIFIF